MAELFAQFIQKAKKQMLKAKDVQDMLLTYQSKDEREAVFIDLASRIYLIYEKALERNKKIDFDDLMMRAIEKIHSTKGECTIWLGSTKSRPVKMNDLRWILIDEYQDFSRLFFELVAAIRTYNPAVRLFCVGDDWQAINGFAGSDLQYFTGFKGWVDSSSVATLATNFRSSVEIVNIGNQLMRGKGTPGKALPEKPGGDVHVEWMDDNWIELRGDEANAGLKAEHERFIITDPSPNGNGKKYNRIIASKYLKRCYEIITSPENSGKTVAILNRTGWIDGVRLTEFKKKLLSCFTPSDQEQIPDPDKMIYVQTAHKYKGLQADLVIILNVTNGAFPLLHPDNALFEIFRKTPADALAEEMRLFYVALTRATTSLYILTEKNRELSFLNCLDCYGPLNSQHQTSRRSIESNYFYNETEEILLTMSKSKSVRHQPTFLGKEIPELPEGYYSSGPNPNLRRFVEEHATPYDPETDKYKVKPFDQPITTTKATAIYNMHTYWSKKPHDAIRQYIRHYTKPGDLVLDPFCGSGGTALAALMEGRAAIAIDLSPAATFITKNYCTPVDTNELQAAFEELKYKVEPEMHWLYETRCDRCDGRAVMSHMVYSQTYQCERCLNKVVLFDCLKAKKVDSNGKEKEVNACPFCYRNGHIEEISSFGERFGQVPVLVSYTCEEGCKPTRSSRSYNDFDPKKRLFFEKYDLEKIREIESKKVSYWYPDADLAELIPYRMLYKQDFRPEDASKLTDLYTKRNLWALSLLISRIKELTLLFDIHSFLL